MLVIILVASSDKKAIEKLIASNEDFKKYSISVIAGDDCKGSLSEMFEHVCSVIQSSPSLPLVVPTDDKSATVHSALATIFPHIRAPSIESVFTCLHKAETYKICPENNTLKYLQFRSDATVNQAALNNANGLQFPLFLKPTMGTGTDNAKMVHNLKEVNAFVRSNEFNISKNAGELGKFVSRFIKDSALVKSCQFAWVLQPFIGLNENKRLISYIGLVCSEKVITWSVYEYVFWENEPTVIKSCASPVDLTPLAKENVREAYLFIIHELKSKGFDHQFAELEAFVDIYGKVSVVEVNGRTPRWFDRCNVAMCGSKGDLVNAMISVARGVIPEGPNADPSVHICSGYVCLFEEGTADEFIDFNQAKTMPDVDLLVEMDTVISPNSEWGHHVAYCHTSGTSRETAMMKCRELVDKIITKKDKCLWLTEL